MGSFILKIIILLLISYNIAFAKKQHPCDTLPQRFKSQNLNDLDKLTKFQRLIQIYPWFVSQCNGTTCSMDEFEKMCYYIRRELKAGRDPNLFFPKQENSLYNKNYRERFEGTDN